VDGTPVSAAAIVPGDSQNRFAASLVPVSVIIVAIIVIWYIATVGLNLAWEKSSAERAGSSPSLMSMVSNTMRQERPVLPAPHQVVTEVYNTTVKKKLTSKRSLVYHAGITLGSSMLGFVMGTLLGIFLAVAIVYNEALNKSLLPWIIASQTIPILAIAPMIIVVLNAIGVQGLLPKAFISMYLSFFPVAIGMVKGLRSADQSQMDLMRTYNASGSQTFWKLRLPTSLPYLFTSMKVAVAISLVGAIVAELPTGAVAGLGARLLAGSYYGQTIQIWSALLVASILAALLVAFIDVLGKWVNRRMGLADV